MNKRLLYFLHHLCIHFSKSIGKLFFFKWDFLFRSCTNCKPSFPLYFFFFHTDGNFIWFTTAFCHCYTWLVGRSSSMPTIPSTRNQEEETLGLRDYHDPKGFILRVKKPYEVFLMTDATDMNLSIKINKNRWRSQQCYLVQYYLLFRRFGIHRCS